MEDPKREIASAIAVLYATVKAVQDWTPEELRECVPDSPKVTALERIIRDFQALDPAMVVRVLVLVAKEEERL